MGETSPGNGNFQTAEVRDHGLIRLDELPRKEIDAHWALVRARLAGGEPASPPALVPEDDVRPMLALPPVPGSEKAAGAEESGAAYADKAEEPAGESGKGLSAAETTYNEEPGQEPLANGHTASVVEFSQQPYADTEAARRLQLRHAVVTAVKVPALPGLHPDNETAIRHTTAGHILEADAIGESLDRKLIFGSLLPYWRERMKLDVHNGQAMITEWILDPTSGLSTDEHARIEEAIAEGREVQSLVKSKLRGESRDLLPVVNFILGGLVLSQRYSEEASPPMNVFAREWWDTMRDRAVVLSQVVTAAWLLDLTHRQDLANINEKWAKLPLLTMVELDMRDNPHTRRIEPKTIARLRPVWYRGPLRRTAATDRYLSRADRELPKKLLAQEQALMLDHKRQLEAMAAAEGGAGHEDETGSE